MTAAKLHRAALASSPRRPYGSCGTSTEDQQLSTGAVLARGGLGHEVATRMGANQRAGVSAAGIGLTCGNGYGRRFEARRIRLTLALPVGTSARKPPISQLSSHCTS